MHKRMMKEIVRKTAISFFLFLFRVYYREACYIRGSRIGNVYLRTEKTKIVAILAVEMRKL